MKISVVIVTYHSASYIGKTLDSVLAQKGADLELIVVDNGSCDSTVEVLKRYNSRIKLICNDHNLGAAAARNQAIHQASGEWVLALDSDTCLKEDFSMSFVRFLQKQKPNNEIGIVATKILYSDRKTIYGIGDQMTFLRRFYEIGHNARDLGQFSSCTQAFGACSAAAFYRMDMLCDIKDRKCGYFDENFFYMVEDVDLAWRARKKGWKTYVCHDCIAYHAGNGSQTLASQKNYYSIRNRFLMMLKNESLSYLVIFCLPLLMYEFARFISLSLKGEGRVYRSAVLSVLKKGALS